jgi:hypothetical protein
VRLRLLLWRAGGLRIIRLSRLLRIFRTFRALSAVALLQRLRFFAYTLFRVLPVLYSMGRIALLLVYTYGFVGCELFSHHQHTVEHLVQESGYNRQFRDDRFANFATFRGSVLVLLQILCGSGWSIPMYRFIAVCGRASVLWPLWRSCVRPLRWLVACDALDCGQAGDGTVALYFASFFFLAVTVLTTVLTAVVLELYARCV